MNLEEQILAAVARKAYQPLKPKALARKLGLPAKDYGSFRWTLRELVKQGRLIIGKNHTVRPTPPHGTVTGIYRKTSTGTGFVRPHVIVGQAGPEILVREENALDASTGDEVLVRITRKPSDYLRCWNERRGSSSALISRETAKDSCAWTAPSLATAFTSAIRAPKAPSPKIKLSSKCFAFQLWKIEEKG